MSADFDPYRKWLGIPPEDRPPNHYRLLGLGLFESDVDAISNAADRQMSHVRTFQSGPHSAISQQLLNELSAARICLLNPASKAEYDRSLRSSLSVSPAPDPPLAGAPLFGAAAPNPAGSRPLGSAARPRSSSSSAGFGEYGLGPPKTLSRPKLRRPMRPQPAARTALIAAAAVAAALLFFAAIFTLTKFKAEPQAESAATTERGQDSSLADARRSKSGLEAGMAPEDAADGRPALANPNRASPDDISANAAPANPRVSPRVGPEETSSGGDRSTDERVELPEIVQTQTQTFDPDRGDFARADGRAFAAAPGGEIGYAAVGFELTAIRGLNVETNVKGELRPFAEDPANSFAGYMVDYHTADGYTHRVALPLGLSSARRDSAGPDFWGKATVPDRYVDLTLASIVHLNLSEWAPADWDGRIWFSAMIQNSGPGTALEGRLVDLIGENGGALASQANGGPVDLLKRIDPNRDAVLGDWSFEGGGLLTSPLQNARLLVPYEPPADYLLRIVAQSKLPKNGALFIGLIVGGRQTSIAIDGWNGQTGGMHLLDGVPAGFNASKREGKVFADDEPKEIVCEVHPHSVLARCGDLTIVDWRGDPASLSMEPRLEVPNKRQLFLAGWDGQFLVSKFELRPLPREPAGAPASIPAGNPSEPPAPPDAREAIPDPSLVRDAGRKVEAKYQNDWRRVKKLADRLAIPIRMIDESQFAESMPMRYALLREASGRAAGMGDAAGACEALDELEKHFRVDALADQLEAVRQSARKLHDTSQAWSAIITALSLADLALRKDQPDLADGFVESAAVASMKSGNLAIRQVIQQRTAAVGRRKRERKKYEDAIERLKAAPDDPAANLTVGRYECFYLGRWRQGLSRLEKSSDPTLAKLAELEKIAATDPSQRAALADAWQEAAAGAGADNGDYLLEANYWRLRSLSKPAVQPGAAPPSAGPGAAAVSIGLARVEPGLAAALFNGGDFQQEILRRVDPLIHLNFGFGSPDPKIGGDNFSIRWTGWLKPPLAGKYVLHASADDGFRLWLDGKKVLDRWGGAGDESKEVDLSDGLHALTIEYNEYGATAAVRLSWKLRDLSTEVTVPAAALFHDSDGLAQLVAPGS